MTGAGAGAGVTTRLAREPADELSLITTPTPVDVRTVVSTAAAGRITTCSGAGAGVTTAGAAVFLRMVNFGGAVGASAGLATAIAAAAAGFPLPPGPADGAVAAFGAVLVMMVARLGAAFFAAAFDFVSTLMMIFLRAFKNFTSSASGAGCAAAAAVRPVDPVTKPAVAADAGSDFVCGDDHSKR